MPLSLLNRCALALSLLLPLSEAGAFELYRYVDEQGVTVLSRQGVPPALVGKGYEVLNEQGRVLRVVPPAPTAEELAQQRADKAQASNDAKLLRLYASVGDVDQALARRLSEVDGVMGITRGNLQSVRTQQANLQSQAAEHERAGRKVPAELLAQIKSLADEQQRLQRDLERQQMSRGQAEADFAADRKRLAELFGDKQ